MAVSDRPSGSPRLPHAELVAVKRKLGAVTLALSGIGILSGLAFNQTLNASRGIEHSLAVDKARSCVSSWEIRPALRQIQVDAISAGAQISIESLLEYSGGRGNEIPEDAVSELTRLVAVRTERQVEIIAARLPDPTCDLSEAQRVIGTDD